MATIAQSNASFLTMMGDTKHSAHALNRKANSAMGWRDRLHVHFGFDVWKLPVCGKCEGYALWDKGYTAVCVHCGHRTHKPITVQEYYEQGYHIDRTIQKDAPFIIDRQFAQGKDLATVYGGEAGLDNKDKKIIIARG